MEQLQRHAFLYFMALVYMFSFGSWLVQIPGLYGDNGLLPIRKVLNSHHKSAESLFAEKPTIIWFLLTYGLEPQTSLELICILGIAVSFLCLIFKSLRCLPVYGLLWLLYLSLFQVGQTFSWFQWDTLLLESGFLTILVAPLTPNGKNAEYQLPLFLVQWLLFRLMFASGVVKLTSMCPTWWGLTALNYHFETQCIPTPMAWWAHQLPKWFLKLSVVGTYVIEIGLPLLFFAPVRSLRLIAAYGQVLLMFSIVTTGNYNFFNLLTITLCFSIFDDKHLKFITRIKERRRKLVSSRSAVDKILCTASRSIVIIPLLVYMYFIGKYFGLKLFFKRDIIYSKIEFTKQEFQSWTDEWVINSTWIGSLYFLAVAASTLFRCLKGKHLSDKAWSFLRYFVMLCICSYMFCISMIPFNSIASTRSSWPILHEWHSATKKYELVHSYGLFRSMTGVDGRPEVIIEGSLASSGPWKEIPFLYKPGNTSRSLPWLMPHQPRLDWQMWFAALGNYQQNAWLVSLVDKLFTNQPDVLKLIDVENYPFKDKPPEYIRADLYHYHFTILRKNGEIPKRVWTRKYSNTYLPVLHKGDNTMQDFLKYHNLHVKDKSKKRSDSNRIKRMCGILREYVDMMAAPTLLWSLWLSAILVSMTKAYMWKN